MDVRRIEYFVGVAETLNFSKAAEQMHISHQALSKQVQLLEQELGARLLDRSTTRVALTAVGAKVYDVFKPLLRELNYGYTEVLNFIDQKRSVLRVGYFSGLSYSRMIAPILRHLERQAPDLKIHILATNVDMVQELLERDSIDLGILPMFAEIGLANTVNFSVYSSPLYIIVSERHPWYQKESITEEDLASGNLLAYANRPTEGDLAMMPDLKVASRRIVNNYDTYMGMLRQGDVFGLIGDTHSRREGNFKHFPLPESCPSQSFIIAAYKRLHPLRHLLKTLKDLHLDGVLPNEPQD